jgi:hypothetical protein
MDFIEQLRPYRPLLWGISIFGLFGVNGVFLYFAFLHPLTMLGALENPIGAVFIAEALLMTAILSLIIGLTDIKKPGWFTFVVLSFVGSLVFSVPAFLLLHLRNKKDSSDKSRHQ